MELKNAIYLRNAKKKVYMTSSKLYKKGREKNKTNKCFYINNENNSKRDHKYTDVFVFEFYNINRVNFGHVV